MQYLGKTPALSRTGFLARAGTALVLGVTGTDALAGRATAASGPLADLDLALARLAVGIELLAADFTAAAIDSKQFGGDELRVLRRTAFNEGEHLVAVSEILTGAGQTASTADDFDFAYPKGAFDSRTSIAQLGVALETTSLGAYLGAVDAFTAGDLKTTAARIGASEAEHMSFFSRIANGRPVGVSFPAPLDYANASVALDPFLGG